MSVLARRTVQGLAALALAGGLALSAPAPAQAGVLDCTGFLSDHGYIVGPNVYLACTEALEWNGHVKCFDRLVSIRVDPDHADEACFLV
ncbi:hypothetical protein GCM10009853_030520 [Glycomyces scopariae]|uniref:Uncharacterized protein n=1 Tax=Glycomyces sambucus TaxID=380244 RepID=A0A1G9G2H4_9ACTN|nr:hypothetical protein [Glycomyces sambucus]SDK94841.1 hypothetical protein SAMN05216298_2172 [Glycomyces sambucus]